jgi:hypothetical protein
MNTHKWILIVLAFLGGVLGIAQNETVKPSDSILSKEYISPDRRFKVRFPDVPKEFDLQADTKTGPIVSHTVMYTSTISYWLAYTDFPISFDKADAIKATLDNTRDGSLASVAKEDPRVMMESDILVDGYPGRFLRVELKGDAIIRYKIVLTGNRRYVLAVGTPKGDQKNVEAQKRYEKLAASFFDSFKIIPPLQADLTAPWAEYSSAEGKYRVDFPGVPFRWWLAVESLRTPSTFYTTGYSSSGQYTVMYLDYAETPSPTDRAALKAFLDDLRDGQKDRQEQAGGKFTVLSETDITFKGNPGRLMMADINGMAIFRAKIVVVKSRVYFITAVMPKDVPKGADTKVYEKLSRKFIDSFKLMREQ